jgi:hypothetical protein
MSHFAQIDDNNIVVNIVVCDDSMANEGHDFLVESLGGRWVKTSYNTVHGSHRFGGSPLRKNYASIGSSYDEELDAFIPPKPFASWVLNSETCDWEAPVSKPIEGIYLWNEETLTWIEEN